MKIKFSTKDFEKNILKEVNKNLKQGFSSKCPSCGKTITAKVGTYSCSYCKTTVSLKGHV